MGHCRSRPLRLASSVAPCTQSPNGGLTDEAIPMASNLFIHNTDAANGGKCSDYKLFGI